MVSSDDHKFLILKQSNKSIFNCYCSLCPVQQIVAYPKIFTKNTVYYFFLFALFIYLSHLPLTNLNFCIVYEVGSQGPSKNLYRYPITAEPLPEKLFISHGIAVVPWLFDSLVPFICPCTNATVLIIVA